MHGYYSLPIFHDGQLIGRLDAKTHRAERRLEVRHVHFEPWFATARGRRRAAGARSTATRRSPGSPRRCARSPTFVGADDVTLGRVTPPRLRAALTRALDLAQSQTTLTSFSTARNSGSPV